MNNLVARTLNHLNRSGNCVYHLLVNVKNTTFYHNTRDSQ
jgi:hypothetical protein